MIFSELDRYGRSMCVIEDEGQQKGGEKYANWRRQFCERDQK